MPLVAECPKCGRKGNVPDQFRGRQAKCPDCSNRFTIGEPVAAAPSAPPEPPASPAANGSPTPPPGTIVAECPECGFTGRVPERAKGLKVQCRKCGESFIVGAPPTAPCPVAAEESDGPATKLVDNPASATAKDDELPESIGLAPEENKPETVAKVETDLDTIEEAEIVEEAEVVEEEPTPPKRGSQPGTKKIKPAGGSHPGTEAPPSEPDSPWGELDRPAKKPAIRAERKREREEKKESEKNKLWMVAASSGGGVLCLLLIALGLYLYVGNSSSIKEKVASVAATRPSPPVAPTFARKSPPSRPVPRRPNPDPRPIPDKRPVFEPKPPPDVPPPPDKKPPDPEPKDDGWVDASRNPARLGNALVRVTGARVDSVGLKLRDAKVGDTRNYLLIQIEVENQGNNEMIRYTGWGGTRTKPGEEVPTLADDQGNFYRRILLEELQGQVKLELLQPGKKVEDILVFEVPAEKAVRLNLELPGSYLGGKGMLRMRIPMHMVATKGPAKDLGPRPIAEETKQVKDLRAALKKAKDGPTRIKLLGSLGALRVEATPAVPDIARYLKGQNDQVRSAAAEALAFIGPGAREAIPALIAALKDDFWMVRAHAASALGAIGPPAKAAVPLLRQLAKSKDEEVPERAAEALRRIQK